METIANSAGGTAQVAVVAQPSIGFLNGRFNRDGTITEDTEDCLGRITVGLTRSKSTTVLISPLDMLSLMGMAQVLAAKAYGTKGVRRGQTTWQWPTFNPDPERENQAQMARWSVNAAPDWHFPPLAIANQYKDRETGQLKRQRYRLVLVKCSRYEWIARDRRDEVYAAVTSKHPWTPEQTLPEWWKEKASVRRSSPSQESPSLMDGECSHPSKSLPTCLKPKMCRTEARLLARPALKPKIRMMPDSRKKRRETYLRQHTGTKQKMTPTRGGRPSERASTSKC